MVAASVLVVMHSFHIISHVHLYQMLCSNCIHIRVLAGAYSAVPPPASIQKAAATPAAAKAKKSDSSDSSDDSSDEEEKKVASKRTPTVFGLMCEDLKRSRLTAV